MGGLGLGRGGNTGGASGSECFGLIEERSEDNCGILLQLFSNLIMRALS